MTPPKHLKARAFTVRWLSCIKTDLSVNQEYVKDNTFIEVL